MDKQRQARPLWDFQRTLLSGLFQSQSPVGLISGVQWPSSLFPYTTRRVTWGQWEDHSVCPTSITLAEHFGSLDPVFLWKPPSWWKTWEVRLTSLSDYSGWYGFFFFFSKKVEIRPSVLYYQFNYWVEVSPVTWWGFNHLQKGITGRDHWVGTYRGFSLHVKGGERPVILQQFNLGLIVKRDEKMKKITFWTYYGTCHMLVLSHMLF